MKKQLNLMLNKCKSLSRQLGRSSSYSSSSSRSKSSEESWGQETVFVGTTRKRYAISSDQLNHPLLNALIDHDKSRECPGGEILVKCEVVLFDHLLWMLDNAEPQLTTDSFEELAKLYVL
ncbi:auxin-responsive protein SAUR76-like [Cornus florida]|uniref:auxin-responsive protein SAUR76-like n=1 Tax=Cornus florida TaxID=4283 RepID=UPI002899303C|nr:auxin-responsive protein SAUR76-like [Cornus florida]